MMLMLKMLVLKMVKKYINIYKYELSLFGRDDTKQAKSLIFIVVPQVEQFPKVVSEYLPRFFNGLVMIDIFSIFRIKTRISRRSKLKIS